MHRRVTFIPPGPLGGPLVLGFVGFSFFAHVRVCVCVCVCTAGVTGDVAGDSTVLISTCHACFGGVFLL